MNRTALKVIVFCPCFMWICGCAVFSEMMFSGDHGTNPGLPGSSEVGLGDKYVLGAGDVIDVFVWKDEALSRTITITPDGTLNLPLLGEVRAADRTIAEVTAEIEERLRPYVLDPVVSISVRQVTSMIIYVLGRVNNPGRFPVTNHVTVLQALAMAGGLNPFAKRNEIKVFRTENGKNIVIPFRYDDVAKGINLEQNILLKRGDVILVP